MVFQNLSSLEQYDGSSVIDVDPVRPEHLRYLRDTNRLFSFDLQNIDPLQPVAHWRVGIRKDELVNPLILLQTPLLLRRSLPSWLPQIMCTSGGLRFLIKNKVHPYPPL